MKIGYTNNAYPDIRCIINKIENKEISYVRVRNNSIAKKYYALMKKITRSSKLNRYQNIFKNNSRKIDLIHAFNYICYTKKPWITTFETLLPRRYEIMHYHHEISEYKITENVKKDILAIASENCKKIIALSECNKKIQEDFLNNFDKENQKKINDKLIVMHPPQKLLLTEEELKQKFKQNKNIIDFLFIGNDFFRKGRNTNFECFRKNTK